MLQQGWGSPRKELFLDAAASGSLAAVRLLLRDEVFVRTVLKASHTPDQKVVADPVKVASEMDSLLADLLKKFPSAEDEMTLAIAGRQAGRGPEQQAQGFGVDDSEFWALMDWTFQDPEESCKPTDAWPVGEEIELKKEAIRQEGEWRSKKEERQSDSGDCSRSEWTESEVYRFLSTGDVFFEKSSLMQSGSIFDEVGIKDFVKDRRIFGWGRWNIQATGLAIKGIVMEVESQRFSNFRFSSFGPLPRVYEAQFTRGEFVQKFSKQCEWEEQTSEMMQERKQFGDALRQMLKDLDAQLKKAGEQQGPTADADGTKGNGKDKVEDSTPQRTSSKQPQRK